MEASEQSTEPCALCGNSSRIRIIGTFKSYTGSLKWCQARDSMSVSPMPTQEFLKSYYLGFKFAAPSNMKIQRKISAWLMCRKARKVLAEIEGLKPKFQTILDYGGGSGAFSRAFRGLGRQVDLFDLDSSLFPELESLGVNCYSDPPKKQYDVVFSSHVVEHCVDPNTFFGDIKNLTKLDGIAVIACPLKGCKEYWRLAHFWSYSKKLDLGLRQFFANPRVCIDPPRHLWAFSKESLILLAEKHGFKVEAAFTEFSGNTVFESNLIYSILNIRQVCLPWRLLRNVLFSTLSKTNSILGKRTSSSGDNIVLILRKIS